nr:MAG TPA: Protein of unknown function (DUF1372) [Bacteriophage sp.]
MKNNHNTFVYLCLFLLILCISSQANEIKRLKAKRPEIIYKVDNAGSGLAGIVTGKEFDGNRYTITVSGYGKFLVNKEQYDRAEIGKGWKHE